MTLSELKNKDVIQFKSGERLGQVDDIRFDTVDAKLQAVILHGRRRLFGLLGRDEDLEISWKDIKSVGLDVIMVDVPDVPPHQSRHCCFW